MSIYGGAIGKKELPFPSHYCMEYRDGDDNVIIDCYTCNQKYCSVEHHVVSVNGPYGPFLEGTDGRE